MNPKQIQEGLYTFDFLSRERRFCFLGQTSFRLYDSTAPESCCVDSATPYGKPEVEERGDRSIFTLGELRVTVNADGTFLVESGEETLLDVRRLDGVEEKEGFGLLEKEGHRHEGSADYHDGFKILGSRPVYGLGERTGPLDKRGYAYVNWNTDDPSAHVDTFPSLYQSIPFFILFSPKRCIGIFLDNPSKTRFDFNKTEQNAIRIEYDEPYLNLYAFVGSMEEVIAQYTALTGRNPLVPYWSLGAQQSRWSYASAKVVDEVIEGYEKADIPLSVVYLDIDYMDHYKDFSVNAETFPDIAGWIKAKNQQGVRIVPIIDAGVKAEEGYDVYDEGMAGGYFCTLHGETYHNEVWPGDSVFPAFLDENVQRWWATHIARMLDLGFSGIWNDMNEPASFRGPLPLDVMMGKGVPHRLAHNVYAHHMVKAGAMGFALREQRLFQLTRAGYAGTCRYSASWAGDNQSIYDHLRLSLPELMNMSLSGQSYIGVDIGGFGGDATPELLVRWAVGSIFNPLYRNHSSLGTKDQEPYRLTGDELDAYRKAVMTRYELLPTLYDELYFAETKGTVPLRPLVYNYPEDGNVTNENTEVMLGENLLLAPALFPGERNRSCYFPETYYDFFTGERYEKGDHLISVGLSEIPLFVREGGLVVLAPKGNRLSAPSDTLRLLATPGAEKVLHFEDEGDGLGYRDGKYNLFEISIVAGKPKIAYLHHGLKTKYQKLILENIGKKPLILPFEAVEK